MKSSHKSIFLVSLITILTLSQSTGSHAEDISLKGFLDDNAIFTLLHHKDAQTGGLNVVSVSEARSNALDAKDRIAGYPISGKLKDLNREKSFYLANLLLDKNNYSNLRQRCLNQELNGIRFSVDDDKVEVVIGSPCNQIFVVFKHENETQWWGNTLGEGAMKKALKLLCVDDLNQ